MRGSCCEGSSVFVLGSDVDSVETVGNAVELIASKLG
jgi:hypothetical protein